VETQPQYFRGSWREVVERAFDHPDVAGEARAFALDGGALGVRFGADPAIVPGEVRMEAPAGAWPGWISRLAPAETAARRASPSRLSDTAQVPAPSPLAEIGGLGRYRRGDVIHRLLQLLPDVAAADRAQAARRMLARELDLTLDQQAEMAAAALSVLEDQRFAAVFGPGSRAEVALAGGSLRLPAALAVSGRLDRLLVERDRVLVVDFKTNRPSPGRIDDADPAYVLQMAVYWAVLQEIFPGRQVEAALVWTDGPKLMPVPENLMARALDELDRAG
jgi:ATP-dependent helicase/nuclease subunit A